MLFDSINLVEGSEVTNLVVDKGAVFPSDASEGELFYNDGTGAFQEALYIFNGGIWARQLDENATINDMLPDSVTAGTYTKVTTNVKGIITSGENPTTLSGYGITDAQALDADLTAISAIIGTSGFLKKTGSNAWALDTNTFLTSNQNINITGDATGSGTTDINLALAATGIAAGSYGTASNIASITLDTKGRATNAANIPIAIDASAVTTGSFINARISQSSVKQHEASFAINESQITDGNIFPRLAGTETVIGSWTFNSPVVGATPSSDSHFTTKAYVDQVAAGINPHGSTKAATTANINLSGTQVIDGITVAIGDRVLVKNQTTDTQNGVYIVASGVWSRAPDFDGSPVNEVETGDLVFVESGTTNSNTSWVVITQGTIIIGTTGIQFSLFSRAGDITAGAGLVKTGNSIDINTASSSRIVINTDNIDLATTGITPGTYTSVTLDAYGRASGGSTTQLWSTITSTPTTLAGYGIIDAQSLDGDLTAIAALAGTSGFLKKTAVNTWTLDAGNGITNLSATTSSSTVTIVSDTGSDAIIPAATSSTAGALTATDKTKLDGITVATLPVINPTTPKDGDIRITAGPVISIYATSAWRQIFPAVYS